MYLHLLRSLIVSLCKSSLTMSTILKTSTLNIMINFIKMFRTINILYISLIHINQLNSNQHIMMKLSCLMKISLKKNTTKNILMNTIMIMKKIFIRQIQKKKCFMKQSIMMKLSYLSQIYLKNQLITSTSFMFKSSSLTSILAVYIRQHFNLTTSYINMFNLFIKNSKHNSQFRQSWV